MSTDTDDPRQRLRPEAARKLADFIRNNLDVISQESIRLYDQRYSYSTHGGVQGEGIARWANTWETLGVASRIELAVLANS